ncbi:hypothetical protein AC578_1446 [Pseudocercospora eumusae]|uniref:F-box domain-containing protein n=1 Tax=Pseudocercospora eumusae TaxID=321146 RepID=A0A139GTI7_9PEZI|nr:hypothetical protein AC578_1446 [Pseudocercospora eumusae]
MSTTASATSRVFATAELLEAILLEADTHTVLFAQRVNCNFQTCIKESPPLQQKLFFKPVSANSAIEPHKDEPGQNPLLFKTICIPDSDDPPVEGGPFSRSRVWANETSIMQFELYYSKDEDGREVLLMDFDDSEVDKLRRDLENLVPQHPTFLDMYPCQNADSKLRIRVISDRHPCIRPGEVWFHMVVDVQMRPLGQLLQFSMSMQRALKSILRAWEEYEVRFMAYYQNYRKIRTRGAVSDESILVEPDYPDKPNEDLEWKKHFTAQQCDMMVDTPKLF